MRRCISILMLLFCMLTFGNMNVSAAEKTDIGDFELPAPKAPNYFIYTDGDAKEGQHDDMRMIMMADPEVVALAAEYDRDSSAFYEKYGLYSFTMAMQYDVSLDNEDNWQYTSEWDENFYTSGYGDGYPYEVINDSMMEDLEFFWLTYHEGQGEDTFVPYQPAIITDTYVSGDYEENIYSFDTENHSLYIRCRYYMEWETYDGETVGEKQSKYSEWSESAIFGKNSTQIIPDEPTVYEAPIISELKIVLPDENDSRCHLEYYQETPESVWETNVYYLMTGEGNFDGLETQVSINGGEWQEFSTADSWGDWCLSNTIRGVFNDNVAIEENSNVKLRIRFNGTHGPSEWSNVLEVNGGGTQEIPNETKEPDTEETTAEPDEPGTQKTDENDKCSLCGFCPEPLGICIFIIIAVVVVVIIVVIVIIAVAGKKKCPKCGKKCKKNSKECPHCGAQV